MSSLKNSIENLFEHPSGGESVGIIERERKRIEQEVKLFMQEHELAVEKHYKVSWNSVDTTRLDTKRFRQEEPEIYQKYAAVSTSRRFSVKAA